jgi:hypothetical protein
VNITRRHLLATSALVPLTACGAGMSDGGNATSPVQDDGLSQGIAFAQQIAAALGNLVAGYPKLRDLIGAATFDEVTKWTGIVEGAASQLSGLTSKSSAASIIATLIPAGVKVLSLIGVALPPPYDLILPAVATLLPTLAGMFGLQQVVPMSRHARTARAAGMTPDHAFAVLQRFNASRSR